MRSVEVLKSYSNGTENRYKPQPDYVDISVLKTVDCNRSMSSNPIASAIFIRQSPDYSGLCRFWRLDFSATSSRIVSASFQLFPQPLPYDTTPPIKSIGRTKA